MIAHARLVVIGGDCHRLHEEIITAGGMVREGRLNTLPRQSGREIDMPGVQLP
jgi:hypothetical protein